MLHCTEDAAMPLVSALVICYYLLTSWAIDLSFCCGRSIVYNIYTYIIYIIIALTEVLMELIKKVLSSVLQKALRVH